MLTSDTPTIFSVVEFSQPEEAQKAIRDLSDQQLLGRPVFIREVSFSPSFLYISDPFPD